MRTSPSADAEARDRRRDRRVVGCLVGGANRSYEQIAREIRREARSTSSGRQAACRSERRLITATHDLLKLHRAASATG